LLSHTFREGLHCNISEHQVMLGEPSFNTRPIREKTCELLFEKMQVRHPT
jgi:actin-related protein